MKRVATLALLLLAGCTVGPNYLPPSVSMPDRFLEDPAVPGSQYAELARWWRSFGDPQLSGLVESALAQNLDVHSAAARITEARALEQTARSAAMPQIAAQGSVTQQRISENALPAPPVGGGPSSGGFALPGEEFTTWRVGFDAGWEIDLFGRNVREREAASARSRAAVWSYHDAQVLVAAEVASAYLRLRAVQAQVGNAQAEVTRQGRLAELIAVQERAGLITGQEVARQRSEAAAAASAVPILQARARGEVHALGVLTGANPDALAAELAEPVAVPTPPAVPAGLPSDLLRRRPDIRAAEREAAAATADVGIAVADLYPRFSLTAAPSLVSTALTTLLQWGSRSFSVGAGIDWPLFDGGRRRATVEARTARQQQALIAYRKAVLMALRDVEDSLSRIEGDRGRLEGLINALASASRAEDIARARFRGGLVTYADVLHAQALKLSLEGQVIETKDALARDTVALLKALGGGWQPGAVQ